MFIYIPQGKAGRLTKDSASFKYFGIQGLFTDNFSSCAYISCISKDKISLMHIDAQSCTDEADFRAIQHELEWVEGDKSIIIVTRPDSVVGKILRVMFQKYLPEMAKSIQWQLMDGKNDGLHVSLINGGNSPWHPQISVYPQTQPQIILHHPQQDQFFYVQIIEQIIGLNAKTKGYIRPRKTLVIYDGSFCAMQPSDLIVDTGHPLTKHEMDQFKSNTSLITIANTLSGLINYLRTIITIIGKTVDLTFDVAPSFESYLNPNNALGILKCNIRDCLLAQPAVTTEDFSFQQKILSALDQATMDFQQLSREFSEFADSATPITPYRNDVLSEFDEFSKQYQSRQTKVEQVAYQERQLSIASKQLLLAMQHYRNKNYSEAYPLFQNVLQLHLLYSKNDNDDLGTAAYNLGRCLFQLGKFQEAIYFYQVSIELWTNAKSSPLLKTKAEKVITESQQQLDEANAIPRQALSI